MFRQRRAAHGEDLVRHLEDRLGTCLHVAQRVRHDVRMEVAVGDVSPDRIAQSARFERAAIERDRCLECVEGDDHVAGRLVHAGVHACLHAGDVAVDACGHGLAQLEHPRHRTVIARHRQHRILRDAARVEHVRERGERRIIITGYFDLHQHEDRALGGSCDARPGEGLIRHERERACVHELHRGHVERPVAAPRQSRLLAEGCGERHGLCIGGAGHKRRALARQGHDAEGRLHNHAERPFRSDEQVDQIHVVARVVAGRELRHVGHDIRGHRHHLGSFGPAALDQEDCAVGQHHRQGLDPAARAAVLEGCRAGGVGRQRSTHERAVVGWNRRVVETSRRERALEFRKRQAGADADAHRTGVDGQAGQAPRAEHDIAARCGAAGERGLRADRQDVIGGGDKRGHLLDGAWERDALRVSTRHVRGIAEKAADDVGPRVDLRCHDVPRSFASHAAYAAGDSMT